ncbi:MAG: aspartyl/glutamyl-tRNA(Asn/Gln) amidotransferase subunit C [Oligoflexia bacterium]|nr:MAG: aspartyl/glutamyl-tRNA(Asn/Gln) amidotransferase subunit C [Oligoflexia bacterium]
MVDLKTIRKIAKLSMIEMSENEEADFSSQLSKAIEYFNQVSEVDTKNVDPMTTPTEIVPHYREDVPAQVVSPEEILAIAPERTGNLYTVPPVV